MLTLLLSQDGDKALMLACKNKQEAAAAELMEATKRAGALDLQGGLGRQGFGGDKELKKSALHWASAQGMAGTVAQLLALGADVTLTTSVRASISVYRSTCIDLYTWKRKYTSVRCGMETRALVSGQFLDR